MSFISSLVRMYVAAVFAAFILGTVDSLPVENLAACSALPNGTMTALNWWNCDADQGYPIKVKSISLVNGANAAVYPLDLKQVLTLVADSVNTGPMTYNKIVEHVSISFYRKPIFANKCKWQTFPIPINEENCGNCPLKPGKLSLKYKIDFSLFGSIINALGKNTDIQLKVAIENGDVSDPRNHKISCVEVQAKIL